MFILTHATPKGNPYTVILKGFGMILLSDIVIHETRKSEQDVVRLRHAQFVGITCLQHRATVCRVDEKSNGAASRRPAGDEPTFTDRLTLGTWQHASHVKGLNQETSSSDI